ncbi:unnamed protein product [Cercospora beticola]|nr:unnamed protein product [Cercospora beticola]
MVVIAIMYGISLHNNKSSSIPYRVAYYTALATSISINIIAFIVATVQTKQSTTWSYTTVYSLGRYTHEFWACQMQHNIRQRRSQLGNDCRLASLACNCDHGCSRWDPWLDVAQKPIEPEKLTAQTELRA